MKKLTLISMILLSLILAACGTAQTASSSSASSTAEALPAATQLILGTFKLEETENAVTSEQAAELLPLWQVYQGLTVSGTSAQAEIDALIAQIQETMTASQVEAIRAMSLAQEDVMTLMVEENIIEAAPQQSTSVERSSWAPQGGPDGAMPPSDISGDPSMGMGSQPVSTSNQDSNAGEGTAVASSASVPSALLDALIQLLQSKAA
jgi:hypothetical protein